MDFLCICAISSGPVAITPTVVAHPALVTSFSVSLLRDMHRAVHIDVSDNSRL